jgi:tetratricopeptide (TPR) repeat protein
MSAFVEGQMRRCCCVLLLFSCVFLLADTNQKKTGTTHQVTSARLPVTTSSTQARRSFDRAMREFEEYHLRQTLPDLREAVKEDPSFAQAFILIARITDDPSEQETARTKAKQLAAKVSPDEQLLIRWMADSQESNYIPAISAMNDLLAKYPRDQRLAFLAGDWLNGQQRWDQAVVVLERAVTLFPNYCAAWNDLGYAYAYSGNFSKAFAAMDKYVALEPDEANAHDSYGEILRMAGKFDQALQQYRTSIRLDPNFGSEVGVADTYALMGREQDARDEYERAMVFAWGNGDKVEFELKSAVTWIRENNRKPAEKALNDVAKHAHAAGLARLEAEAHRVLAMYEPDAKAAMKHLQMAEAALQDGHKISASDLEDEQARLLCVLATREAGGPDAESAATAVKQLQDMAVNSRSQVVQLSYHGAAGAVLIAQQKYPEAIEHLQEDSADPQSLRLLWQAYTATGATSQAQAIASKLAALNLPTVEQALVVPQFRATLVSEAQK